MPLLLMLMLIFTPLMPLMLLLLSRHFFAMILLLICTARYARLRYMFAAVIVAIMMPLNAAPLLCYDAAVVPKDAGY